VYVLARVAGYLLSPLTWTLALAAVALVASLARRRRAAAAASALAFAVLWVFSMPGLGGLLIASLESQHPWQPARAVTPRDAIVVLGGGVSGAAPPQRPTYVLGPAAGRVWFAAELYREGKGRLVICAGGTGPGPGVQPEAEAMAEMLQVLGVPRSAILMDPASRNTRENAQESLRIAREAGVRSLLLVTSAAHMGRAMKTFERYSAQTGISVHAAPTDVLGAPGQAHLEMWIPSASGLDLVTNALKEFAGTVALAMI
jgi:uncharacterized SAM-binding protein YcdF (DUF218 family)